MSFWNDLEAAARKVADDVNTEFSVVGREQRIKDAYQALGKLYYQAVSANKAPEGAAFDEQVAKIEALLKEISALRGKQHVTADESDFA